MEIVLKRIVDKLKSEDISQADLDKILRNRNKELHDGKRTASKRRLLSYYLNEKAKCSEVFTSLDIDNTLNERLVALLQAKPRRSASGVATITVLTKPWPCSGDCIYCPNDIRMPKSYMTDEPACQRAERNFFDPYLQVASRIRVLEDMGHFTDKVELIVLGGTWSDYTPAYRKWFIKELLRALNERGSSSEDHASQDAECGRIRCFYENAGFFSDASTLEALAAPLQERIDSRELSYNQALEQISKNSMKMLSEADRCQVGEDALDEQLEAEQHRNESAEHRCVGLVIETRPEKISFDELMTLRKLGATKIQMGIQSLDPVILEANDRASKLETIESAFANIRLFGFKSHIHFMANLYGATPETDRSDFEMLVSDKRFKPDELKLYPLALVRSALLYEKWKDGSWSPYSEDDLIDLLAFDVQAVPEYTRISRMIRDISAKDILCGNRKTNLRQLVEEQVAKNSIPAKEMRIREIALKDEAVDELYLKETMYETSNTEEWFLQFVDANDSLAGFLRLSLPFQDAIESMHAKYPSFPIDKDQAMIREVHVYGRVARIHEEGRGVQHLGLGSRLIDRACNIARDHSYTQLNVISAIGTREYYRDLGFKDNGLYLTKQVSHG